jgi:hypothetical protein
MTTKSTSDLTPTLAEAFDLGRKEGLKEAFTEMKQMVESPTTNDHLKIYIQARLKSILELSVKNPFKQKD